ncbi:MAG: UPF0182 family protein, partial [Micrococcales bacterium]|nr:UPF0182 family protein [Micrococcales bacterium]
LGYANVLYVQWGTRAVVGLLGLLVMAGAVFASMTVAYRTRPVYPPSDAEQRNLEQYREAIEPLRKIVMIALPVVLGLFAAGAAAGHWADVQLFLHRQTVGSKDPQFGLDLGFYFFTLPLLRFVVSFLLATVILAGIVGLATHYLYGGVRIAGRSDAPRTSRAARIHLASTGALLMVVIAATLWLDRYSLLTKSSAKYAGAGYTDVNAVMPAKAILAVAALLVAAVFVVTAVRGNWRLPIAGVAVMIIAAIVAGGLYPAIVQQFQVKPNAQDRESEYIARNIAATRAAYGIDQVDVQPYTPEVNVAAGQLREDTDTTVSIRLLDPTIVSPSFKQQQQIRAFYSFPDTLAVDRYTIDGESRDTVIAVRELNQGGLEQRSWVNDTTVYTHGFGVVAAYGNAVTAQGEPSFFESNIPPTGVLGEYEPRIYFGQMSPRYSIVGGPAGSCWELDYPSGDQTSGATATAPEGADRCAGSGGAGTANTQFPTDTVKAGPSIGNPWNKLLYAIKFGSGDILFSDRVTPQSQILYDRDPKERVAKVAPYLTLDGRVYPAVVDGRVKWIVDGYTTTDRYPYSAPASLQDATTDALTETSATVSALRPQTVNYIRNSVKATVDAYDGSVDLYAWDPDDPVLKAWRAIFPNTVQPMSKISGELMSHLRYPENLFKVQRTLLGRYHETDPKRFYRGDDFWAVSVDPSRTTVDQPPYYLTLKMPCGKQQDPATCQDEASFSLMSTFQPYGSSARPVLTGYMAVDAEAGSTAGTKSAGYGQIRLLELPRSMTVPAPRQASANFDAYAPLVQDLRLLTGGDSTIVRGNLLTLPVGGGLLYVQPLYVQASAGGMTFPKLQRVLVSFGDEIGFAPTLDEALNQVFKGDSGATTGETGDTPPPDDVTPPDDGDQPRPDAKARADLAAALRDANQAIQDSQKALADGDFAAYGKAQDALIAAVTKALEAETRLEQ